MIFRVLDIETIPDPKAFTPNETTYRVVQSQESKKWMTAPGYEAMEIEAVEQFPPPHAHRVVAISYVDITFDAAQVPKYQFSRCYTECRWALDEIGLEAEERKLLFAFGAAMAEPNVHMVTWNGRTFDLPVIVLRSFRHRIPCAWYYGSKDVRYRYSVEGHCDLMDYLSDFVAVRPMKLHDVARLWGLPGKTDMHGSQISDIYESTMRDPLLDAEALRASVARYCLQDSIQTALLFIATRYLLGKITPDTYNAVLSTFADSPAIASAIELDWNRLKL
jgi:3'-5' exonuclease